jgi:hypothetical protein
MIFVLPGLFSAVILVLFIGAAILVNLYKERKLAQYGEQLLNEDN